MRQLSDAVHGDVNGDGLVDTGDLTAVVNYFKAPATLDVDGMTPNQRHWLDANQDGIPANAGDVLATSRMYAASGVGYTVFGELVCPEGEQELVVSASVYSAGQALLDAIAVAVELSYDEPAAWELSVGSVLTSPTPPAGAHYFSLAPGVDGRELRVRPTGGWVAGATLRLAYVVGDREDMGRRTIFVQSSLIGQEMLALQSCTVGSSSSSAPPAPLAPPPARRPVR